MRSLIVVLLLAGFCLAARADVFSAWEDETGQVRIAVAQHGWDVIASPTLGLMHELEATPDADARPWSALCTLSRDDLARPAWISRQNANEETHRTADFLRTMYEARQDFRVDRFEWNTVDGVEVFDVYGGLGTLSGLKRMFHLRRDGRLTRYSLDCNAERNDLARVTTAVAIAESLRITESRDEQ
jgi:hypothetical protein